MAPNFELTQIQVDSQDRLEWVRDDYGCGAPVDKVHHEEREGGQRREEELVAPAQVQHVVREAEENHAADRKQRADKLGELQKR